MILAALTFLLYSFVLQSDFKTMDDQVSIVDNEHIKSFGHIDKIFTTSFFGGNAYYRPLVSLSFMLEYHFFGLNPLFYYLTNIFIHALAAFFGFLIMEAIFAQVSGFSAASRRLAFLIALLFAVHPVHWEAVSNIPGRAILLCGLFNLIAFYCFCLYRSRGRDKRFLFLSLACFASSLLSKESGIVLPLTLAAYLCWGEKESIRSLRILTCVIIPYAFVAAGYLTVRHYLDITHLFYWRSVGESLLGLLAFLRSVITHLRIFVCPLDLHFDRMRPVFLSFTDIELILTVMFFAALGRIFFLLSQKCPRVIWFFAAWFWIELLPVSQFLVSIGVQPGYISTAEHFLYMPSWGMFALMVLGIEIVYEKNKTRRWISLLVFQSFVVAFYIFLAVMTIVQNIYSANEWAMFERTLRFNPKNTRIRTSLGLSYARYHLFPEAQKQFREVLAVDPLNTRARIGLGKSLCDQGHFWEGIQEYEKIQDPGNQKELLEKNLKLTYNILVLKYQDTIKREPANAKAYYSLGVIYSKENDITSAIAQYEKSVGLDPNFREALFNLASSLEVTDRRKEAPAYYERMLALPAADDHLTEYARVHLLDIRRKLGGTQ